MNLSITDADYLGFINNENNLNNVNVIDNNDNNNIISDCIDNIILIMIMFQ